MFNGGSNASRVRQPPERQQLLVPIEQAAFVNAVEPLEDHSVVRSLDQRLLACLPSNA